MNKKHVVHFCYRFATGGLENGLVNLINHLPADQYKHTIVSLKSIDEAFLKRINHPVDVFELNKPEGKSLGYLLDAYRLLRKIKPDIVHTRNIATLEIQLVAWLARVPFRIHGEHGWDTYDLDGSNLRYQKLRYWVGKCVNRFVPLSKELEQYLIAKVKLPETKIKRICNGVRTDVFNPDGEKAAVFETRSAQTLVFGTVGRLETVKNQNATL